MCAHVRSCLCRSMFRGLCVLVCTCHYIFTCVCLCVSANFIVVNGENNNNVRQYYTECVGVCLHAYACVRLCMLEKVNDAKMRI